MGEHIARVAIYVRESRDEGMTAYETIETQRELLVKYTQEHGLGDIVGIFEDDNYSGTDFERPGFRAMEAEMECGGLDIILLKDLSRLGRSNGRTLVFLEYAESLGIRVITFDGRYDSHCNTETAGIDTWFNERYVADISGKIRASLNFKIQSGDYIGTAPYGYRKAADRPGRLEPEPAEAELVREIYRLYSEGWGYKKIAAYLTEQSIPPPQLSRNRSGTWNPQSVRRILISPVYIGTTVQGISEKNSYKSKKTRRLPESQWTVTPDTHIPLVEKPLYEAVQALRRSRQNGSGNYRGRISPFKNLVYCGYCGAKMFSRSSNGGMRHGFICSTYVRKGAGACRRNYIDEADLKALLFPILQASFAACAKAGTIYDSVFAPLFQSARTRNPAQHLELLKKECKELERRECVAYEDRLKGVVSEALFQKISASLDRRKAQLTERIRTLSEISEPVPVPEISALTERQTAQALSCIISEIKVKDGDIRPNYIGLPQPPASSCPSAKSMV